MGAIEFEALKRAARPNPDESVEISAVKPEIQASAMRVACDSGTGQWIYREDEPVTLRIEPRWTPHRSCWLRLEVYVRNDHPTVKVGHHLAVAPFPYSARWSADAPFKKGTHHGPMNLPAPPPEAQKDLAEFIRWVEGLPYDYFERGDYRVAGLSPRKTCARPGKRPRAERQRGLLVFGVCEDFDRAVDETAGSPSLVRLMRQAGEGARPVNPFTGKPLHLNTRDMSSYLMRLSALQAIAGPHRDGHRWLGRPVADKAAEIYGAHLDAHDKYERRRSPDSEPYDDEAPPPEALPGGPFDPDNDPCFDDWASIFGDAPDSPCRD